MSKSEFARFVADLGTDAALRSSVKASASDPTAIVAIAKGKGYAIDVADVRSHLKADRPDLTEKELDAVSAGKAPMKVIIVVVPPIL